MNNSILIRWDTFHINHRLLREERVGRQARHQIDREADDGPVSGVLDLRDVLKLTVDGLDQSPLAQEDFVRDCHKLALHVALKLCYQLDAVHEKSGEEVPADVSLVSDQLSEDPFDEGFVPERIPVVNIARCEHEVQEFPLFAADQMQFEAVEPSHRTLPPLGESLEYLVEADALVPAHAQGGAVHETDARAGSHAASIHEQDERNHHLTLQLDEAVVGNERQEQIRHIPAYLIQVEVFKAFISAQMEQYHDGYHLGVGQPAVPMIPPLRLVPLGGKSVDLDKSVIYSAEVIRHTENFSNFVIVDRHSESLCFCFSKFTKTFAIFLIFNRLNFIELTL